MVWWRERNALERKCGRREGRSGVLGRGLVALLILWCKCGDIKWNMKAPFPLVTRVLYPRGAPCVGWVSPLFHDEARCCGHASRWFIAGSALCGGHQLLCGRA